MEYSGKNSIYQASQSKVSALRVAITKMEYYRDGIKE